MFFNPTNIDTARETIEVSANPPSKSVRGLGAFGNVFALESFLDELCAERGEDPLAFRLRHLDDPRARAVLEAAARRAGWSGRRKSEGVGHGLGRPVGGGDVAALRRRAGVVPTARRQAREGQ